MAEASAVIGILSFGIQVCQGITKYYGAWRNCPEEVSSTSNTIDSLRTLFEQFKDILADRQLEQDTRTLVEERVSACLAGLRRLEAENKQFGTDKPSKFQMAIHRLSYPFKQDTLDRLKKLVGGILGQLSIALQVLDIRAGSRHHNEDSAAIADARQAIEKVYTDVHVVRDLVDSVSAQYQIMLDHANANHVDTITRLETLRLDGQQTSKHVRQLLSDAEAAKLERILTWIRAPDVTSNHNAACLRRHPGTAYFYITFSDDKKQSWEDLLRGLVMQLSQGHSAVQILVDAFDKEFGHGLTVRDLERALMDILEVARCKGRRIFVVIDALDESSDTQDHRDAVYKGLSRLAERCNDLHFLITSRRYADVERFMGGWGALFVEITAPSVNQDISAFVHYQLATNPAFSRVDDSSRSLITAKLGDNPDGMFRWAALHLETLRKLPSKTHARIKNTLSILPPTLSATYELMLSDVPDDCATPIARCLLWLAVSPRPLALHELAEAMYIDPDSPDEAIESDKLDAADILEIIPGMRMQLAHASVEEFLLGYGSNVERVRRFMIDKVKRTSILRRAIDRPDISGYTTLHLAIFHARLDAARLLLAQGANVNTARFGNKETPLHAAVKLGDAEIVADLLACGASVNALTGSGMTALSLAVTIVFCLATAEISGDLDDAVLRLVKGDRAECVRLLLHHGADPNLGSALFMAVTFGLVSMVRLLLDGGANGNSQISLNGMTALRAAVEKGHDDTMTIFAHGGTANMRLYGCTIFHVLCSSLDRETEEAYDSKDNTPQLLPEERFGTILDMLLAQEGVDINVANKFGYTPLMIACKDNNSSFVEKLLNHGPDLEARDDNGWTALFHAVHKGPVPVVELLIARGARVNIVAWLPCEEFQYRRRSLRGAASGWEEYRIVDILKTNGAILKQDMDEDERRCNVPRPPSSAPKRRRSWPQYRDLPLPWIISRDLPLKIIGDLDREESRCDVPCPPPRAPKRQTSWPLYHSPLPVEVIDDTDEEESEWDVPYFPSRAPRRWRSWPQFWDNGPLITRPPASIDPHRPLGDDEMIQWDTSKIPRNSNSFWWKGKRSFTLKRSLSLVEDCM
ncbi:hypothetical protein LTR17_014225 [Elasticomyces elasticus]|nr:hypothetical protein LTR17_014225 [Elasticomyces elasticus]